MKKSTQFRLWYYASSLATAALVLPAFTALFGGMNYKFFLAAGLYVILSGVGTGSNYLMMYFEDLEKKEPPDSLKNRGSIVGQLRPKLLIV